MGLYFQSFFDPRFCIVSLYCKDNIDQIALLCLFDWQDHGPRTHSIHKASAHHPQIVLLFTSIL
mgnify:CR=1 FL=1